MSVYVLDDDAAMRRTLSKMAERAEHEVRCFDSASAFLSTVDDLPAGVLLLDLSLGEASGLDVLSEIAARNPRLSVVVISGTSKVDDAIAAFRGGAVQFLRKPFRKSDLEGALAEAHKLAVARAEKLEKAKRAAAIHLSKREYEVLSGMADGVQSKNIAHALGISIRTVDMHRGNIIAKLSARNAAQAVATARRLELIAS